MASEVLFGLRIILESFWNIFGKLVNKISYFLHAKVDVCPENIKNCAKSSKICLFPMIPPTEEGRPSQGEGAGESVKNRKFSKWVVLLP